MEIKKKDLIYKDGTQKILSIGASAVIINDGKVLLVRGKGGDKFKFPGGHVDDEETIRQSAQREAFEEAGIEIEVIGEPFFYLFELDSTTDIILINYLANIKTGNPEPNTEIEEVKWFDLNKLPENMFDNVAPVLNHFKKDLV